MNWRMLALFALFTTFGIASRQADALEVQGLAKKHQDYANGLYEFVTREGNGYKTWKEGKADFDVGPQAGANAKSYLNSVAAASEEFPQKSCVVTEHFADGELTGITVRLKVADGYDPRNRDWYWAHFLPDGKLATASPQKNPFAKSGFVTSEDEGRLWVFRAGSKELEDYRKNGEPAKIVVRPGAGPNGATVKAADNKTLDDYLK